MGNLLRINRLCLDIGKTFSFFFFAVWLAVLIPFTISSIQFYLSTQKPPKVTPIPSYFENTLGEYPVDLLKQKNANLISQKLNDKISSQKRIAFAILAWAIVITHLLMREQGSDIQQFDPFEILH